MPSARPRTQARPRPRRPDDRRGAALRSPHRSPRRSAPRILVATVVGSGIMAERLAGGNQAIALLGNTIPTGAILVVLITILGPISGAHFNPAVRLVFACRQRAAVARRRALRRGAMPRRDRRRRDRAPDVRPRTADDRHHRRAAARRNGSPRRSRRSRWSSRSSAARASPRRRSRGWWASSSRPPIGSRPRPRSPIRRSRWRAASPRPSPALPLAMCQPS